MGKLKLLRDGNLVGEFDTGVDVAAYIHRTHSYSLFRAIRYEGYSVVDDAGRDVPFSGVFPPPPVAGRRHSADNTEGRR